MYCIKCGSEIKEGERFCRKCGTKAHVPGRGWLSKADSAARRVVPQKLLAMFPMLRPAAFLGIFAVLAVLLVKSGVAGRNDLSGSYYCADSSFLVKSVTFAGDGTFTMVTGSDSVYGRYKKKRGEYYLELRGGSSPNSSNPVTNYKADSLGTFLRFTADRLSENELDLTIYAVISYLEWNGSTARFYKY